MPVSMTRLTATGAFFPAASELHALNDIPRLQRLYLSAAKLGVVALIPLAILPSLMAWPILDAWIGPAFADKSAPILAVLALAYGLLPEVAAKLKQPFRELLLS